MKKTELDRTSFEDGCYYIDSKEGFEMSVVIDGRSIYADGTEYLATVDHGSRFDEAVRDIILDHCECYEGVTVEVAM